ncbi:50S ribosomal protein L11 methyltransferase [Conexibacter sp. JD483]|uniref:50S ribosomal protein L11 methyltransferase n=1 Tax=unclassified Conexibacter TaxID=2627773 RepID=UPI00271869D9|nr:MULTISPECIES: 50S ribosomal protein L11 methyltransferase [unclassified Conexibacter]MDO8184793.1 50S ribosomal protein L11 methyltransferase [Conexibacter sp. CPCC 205706]MDO8196568.1 50S ribosomal protein L11 methyltransferase [Conexibacter sp. CPCC 205762]MDR9368719.1 50S ribosomal protein L11 methyltransferase [Conexibacter sp. JD483]
MIRLALRVAREDAEIALAQLLELAPSGVEEVDAGDWVEYAVYGSPGELPDLPDLRAAVGGALVEVTTSELPDDWSERWKDFHKPLVLGDRLAVRPPWEPSQGTAIELVIDPAQAFGTGSHATTRLCLELLLELADSSPERGPAVDVGCGSGVLAIAAAKLGWEPVVAVDYDQLSVDATIENAAVNDVTLDVRRGDLRSETMPAAPTVLANLLRPLLLEYAADLPEPPRRLIASGLLVHEGDEIAAAFAPHGLRERARVERGEWCALLLAAD